MKCSPMNRSGRSVDEASRVMEIEEVLEASRVSAPNVRGERAEDGLLHRLVFGAASNDQIGRPDLGQALLRPDAAQRGPSSRRRR